MGLFVSYRTIPRTISSAQAAGHTRLTHPHPHSTIVLAFLFHGADSSPLLKQNRSRLSNCLSPVPLNKEVDQESERAGARQKNTSCKHSIQIRCAVSSKTVGWDASNTCIAITYAKKKQTHRPHAHYIDFADNLRLTALDTEVTYTLTHTHNAAAKAKGGELVSNEPRDPCPCLTLAMYPSP